MTHQLYMTHGGKRGRWVRIRIRPVDEQGRPARARWRWALMVSPTTYFLATPDGELVHDAGTDEEGRLVIQTHMHLGVPDAVVPAGLSLRYGELEELEE